VPIVAGRALLGKHGVSAADLHATEIMEAFAVQAMACADGLGLDPAVVNPGGGALARGHPIGASGAILCVRLFEQKKKAARGGFRGLAAIAAAGGLGSALLLE
jgi:acetyl-CoA C-acetyltransferase